MSKSSKFVSRHSFRPALCCLHMLVVLGVAAIQLHAEARGQEPNAWETGHAAFAGGDFPAAVRAFDLALAEGMKGAETYFNLGLAKARAGEVAPASLALLRALAIDPAYAPARQALEQLAAEHQLPVPPQGPADRLVAMFGSHQLWVAGCVTAWIGVALLLTGSYRSAKRAPWIVFGALALLGGAGVLGMTYTGDPLVVGRALAVVQGNGATTLQANPTDGAGAVEKLPAGAVVDRVSERGRWSFVVLPGGKQGWIPTEKLMFVVPDSGS